MRRDIVLILFRVLHKIEGYFFYQEKAHGSDMKLCQSVSPLHTTHLDSAGIRNMCGQLELIPQSTVTDFLPLVTRLPLYSSQLEPTQEGQARLFPEGASAI